MAMDFLGKQLTGEKECSIICSAEQTKMTSKPRASSITGKKNLVNK